jgi:hypothetical protein
MSEYRTDWPSTEIESRPVAVWSSVSYFASTVSANVAIAAPCSAAPKKKPAEPLRAVQQASFSSPKTQGWPALFLGA